MAVLRIYFYLPIDFLRGKRQTFRTDKTKWLKINFNTVSNMPFKKENKYGKGGKRRNSGRKPDEFKAIMAQIASSDQAMELVRKVIQGEGVGEFIVSDTGAQISLKPDAITRLKFLQYATDYGYGKPNQPIDATVREAEPIQFVPANAPGRGK